MSVLFVLPPHVYVELPLATRQSYLRRATGKKITLYPEGRSGTKEHIVGRVCQALDVDPEELFTRSRLTQYVEARRVICVLMTMANLWEREEIARLIRRDRTTVLHHLQAHAELCGSKDERYLKSLNDCYKAVYNQEPPPSLYERKI